MGAIGDKFNEIYRDYATDGVKSSGPYNPEKSEQRAIGALIENAISNAALGALVDVAYATLAELEADLAHADGSVGLVHSDPVDANNDLYTKSGASGAGAWTLTTVLRDAIGVIAQPFVDAAEAAQLAAEAAAEFIGLGNQMEKSGFRYLPSSPNGATTSRYTTTIPAGQTGDNAILYGYWKVPGERWNGRTVQLIQTFKTSDPFTRAPDKIGLLVGLAAGGSAPRTANVTGLTIDIVGTKITVTSEYTMLGDEAELIWGAQLDGSGGAAANTETIKLIGWETRFSAVPAGENKAKVNLEQRMARLVEAPWVMRYASGARNGLYHEKIIVAQAGGDFTDPLLAIAQANDLQPGPDHRIEIEVGPGDFDFDGELQPGNFVFLHGMGPRGPNRSLLRFFQDDGATTAQIDTDSVVRLQYTSGLRGLAIWGKNVRYAVHPEIPLVGKAPGTIWTIEDCDIRHFAKTSPNGNNAPGGRNTIGSGTGDGYTFLVHYNDLWSETGKPFAWHNNQGHLQPTLVDVRGNRMAGGLGTAMAIVAYGSGQADELRYTGNSLTGDVDMGILPGGDVEELRVIGHGNTPHAIRSSGAYLPEVTDEERSLLNGGGSAIGAGDVLAFLGNEDTVRLMQDVDDASLFAGIALEPIADGASGRVKTDGRMHLDHLNTDEVAVVFNATMSVGATPGKVAAGGAQSLLMAVSDTVVRVR